VRLLFTVYGSRPHLYPLVPLGWAFRAAGHEVRVASPPHWTRDVAATGLPAVTVGGSPRVSREVRDELASAMFRQDRPWPTDWAVHPTRLDQDKLAYLRLAGRYMIAAADGMVDELVDFARDWKPHAVVYDSFSYAGPVAAAAVGAAAVRHLSGTDSAQRLELDPVGTEPLPEYAGMFSRFGLDVPTEASATVEPTPPSMRLARRAPRQFDMRYVPFNGPGTAPDDLHGPRRRPRVCVTWGQTLSSAIGAEGANPFLQAIEAITALDMECFVAGPTADLERLGPLPESVRAPGYLPLHLVLPYCDAIVHQGGDGTALTAATTAIPQLIISVSAESDMCGGRIAAARAGIYLPYPDLRDDPDSPVVIRHAIQALLSDRRFADGAARLREEIESQPTPADVVTALADLLA
jgi:UDP:flavonoid glycosyltransferase YjiC (YdhE family)